MRRWLLLALGVLLAALWLALQSEPDTPVAPTARIADAADASSEPASPVEADPDPRARTVLEAATDGVVGEPEPEDRHSPLPSASLIVRTRLADGSPWAGSQVQVQARFAPRRGSSPDRGRRSASGWSIQGSGPLGHVVAMGTDEHGMLELHDVVPDLPLTVRLVDGLGTELASVAGLSLSAGERREIELRASRFPVPLAGRCLDEDGRALPGATVAIGPLVHGDLPFRFGLNPPVDEAGRFETGPLSCEAVILHATFEDRIAVERLAVPVDGSEVEIVLRRGRNLRVALQDESGAPSPDAWLRVHLPAIESPLDVRWDDRDGDREYALLPREDLELRWGSPCGGDRLHVGVEVERVLVRVARHGTLWIEVGALPGDTSTPYAAGLYCLDGATPVVPLHGVLNTGHQQVRWTLAAGRYRVQLLHQPSQARGAWEPWGAPLEVEVRSGETTLERLGG